MPRFIVDENVPLSVTRWLKEKYAGVVRTSEVNLRGAPDEEVIDFPCSSYIFPIDCFPRSFRC